QRRPDPGVVADLARAARGGPGLRLGERDVVIDPDEHPLALDRELGDRLDPCHLIETHAPSFSAMNRVRSTRRCQYAISLSYQAITVTRSPVAVVSGASSTDECRSPLKSRDTSGSSLTARMPLSGPAAAARNASLTSWAVALRSSRAVRSTSETLGVGTRIAMPSSLPAIAGSTSLSALAAPVVVGIIDSAAARARRRSLWGRSRICWSLVYEWIGVISADTRPELSCSTLATGARQLVVHDALEMMWCSAGLYMSRLMPMHSVTSGFLAGAEITTFLAPPARCLPA